LIGFAIIYISFIAFSLNPVQRRNFKPEFKVQFLLLIFIVLVLTWLGIKVADAPYRNIGKTTSSLYFSAISFYIISKG